MRVRPHSIVRVPLGLELDHNALPVGECRTRMRSVENLSARSGGLKSSRLISFVGARQHNVMRKLELSSPAAPVRYAIRNRLVEAQRQSWPIPHNPTPLSSDLRKTLISKERSPSSDGEHVAED